MLFRLVATMIGCAYGPYLYLVLPLGGLYLAADALLLYAIWKALAAVRPVRIFLKNSKPGYKRQAFGDLGQVFFVKFILNELTLGLGFGFRFILLK